MLVFLVSFGFQFPHPNVTIVVQLLSRVRLCDPRGCSTLGFPVLHHLLEFAQVQVHGVSSVCSAQSLSRVRLFATPWTAAPSLSITNSWSLPRLMPMESVMPSSHLILLLMWNNEQRKQLL